MQIVHVIRTYLDTTQYKLAKAAGITQPDISEIETLPPYGYIAKYVRLSEYLGIPMDALIKNDFTLIPESFFDRFPPPEYSPFPHDKDQILGRLGEDYILAREQERLNQVYPALAKLVLPLYKMKGNFRGYDILSFDDNGIPFYIEVKTTRSSCTTIKLTSNEYAVAKEFTEAGEKYLVSNIINWGKKSQRVIDVTYEEIENSYVIEPKKFYCKPYTEPKNRKMTGMAYYRRLRDLKQADIAKELGIQPDKWSQYETGSQTPCVETLIKISDLLSATIDDLMAEYIPDERGECRG